MSDQKPVDKTPTAIKVLAWALVFALVVALSLFASCPSGAQVPPDPSEEPRETRLVASGWCAIHSGDVDPDAPGCDIGVGIALYRAKRVAVVAAIGTETLGGGIAWVAQRGGPGRPTIAISLGVVARYDERGIHAGELYPALGATFGLGGSR